MKKKLIEDICVILLRNDIEADTVNDVRQELIIIMDNYDIDSRCTDLIIHDERKNEVLIQRFLSAKIASGRTPRTISFYRQTLCSIDRRLGRNFDELTADDIRLMAAVRLKRDGISKVAVNNELRVLSSFYTYLFNEGLVKKNPMLKVEKIKMAPQKKSAFTPLELERIRRGCRTKRDRAIIEVLCSTWCRVSELVNIRLDEIEEDGRITVHGKGEKDRFVFLNAKAQLAVTDYMDERSDSNPYLFPKMIDKGNTQRGKNIKQEWYKHPELVDPIDHCDQGTIESRVRSIGKRESVENVHPHRFRRTGATMALKTGMPLIDVSHLLGHQSISTTQIYLDVNDDDLRQAHQKYVL